jgi:hypothetical protein
MVDMEERRKVVICTRSWMDLRQSLSVYLKNRISKVGAASLSSVEQET